MKTAAPRTGISIVLGFAIVLVVQVAAQQPGRGRGMQFTEPSPIDFTDHEGYVSIFDGRTLDGWDGNPKFWRVEDGAIVGESTPERPSGNSYIAYRRMEAKDFTLKFEIKVEGTGGSGLQYRSRTGLPWLANISRSGHRVQRTGQSELDDDRSAGRLLAEPRLHRPVLFGEHADAHPGVARTGRRRLRRTAEAIGGHHR